MQKDLNVKLLIGYNVVNGYTREVQLLKSNAVAEEVFTKKIAERPFTWIGNVVTIACGSIGGVPVGAAAREHYLKHQTVEIPSVVKSMPLADANSLLLEVHRKVWKAVIPNQSVICKVCSRQLPAEIDLSKVTLAEEEAAKLEGNPEITHITVDLSDGLDLTEFFAKSKNPEFFQEVAGVEFNRLTYRVPTLGDAIRNEKFVSNNIDFWRRMAADCLYAIERVEEDGVVSAAYPEDKLVWLGMLIYNYLSTEDLGKIRKALRDELPTMPFSYEEECPCDMKRVIPHAMEASSFFSE
jgi:hypothetical protein